MIGLDRLAEAPAGLTLALKATLILAAAWSAHAALARANPRWRALTWRCAAIGLAVVAALAFAPPLATWRAAPMIATPAAPDAGRPAIEPVDPVAAFEPLPHAHAVATRAAAEPSPPIDLGAWLVAGWLAGVAAGLGRLAVGRGRLRRIIRGASDAPAGVVEALRATAEALGVRGPVRVVVSSAIGSPCIAGAHRPTVLLPAGAGLEAPGPDLDAVLVHELTHVRNGDLAWNGLLSLAAVALWFHPLAWRIRAAHAAACDAVCDAVAVDRLGDVATYGRALARLALRASAPAGGLAMARACDVRRRVEALRRKVHRSALPGRLVMPAVSLSTALAVLVGGAAVIRAQDDPATGPRALVVRVLDAATGMPVGGAEVESTFFDAHIDKIVEATATTAADGTARVEHGPDARPEYLSLIVRKPGYAPASSHRGSGWRNEPFAMPESEEFRLVRGAELGGVVVDEAGAPVAGATVELTAPYDDTGFPMVSMTIATVKTDARGRWRTDQAPRSLGDVHIKVDHPDYPSTGERPSRGDLRIALAKGGTVAGRVVGPDGRPIAGAAVKLRATTSPPAIVEATTDAEGRYALQHARPGNSQIMAEADGFAPAFRNVEVEAGGELEGIDVPMEPGAALRVRVVDAEGGPLPGVTVAPAAARGRFWTPSFRAKTDAEGRAVWKDAPRDESAIRFYRRDLAAVTASLAPGDEERVVVLRPPRVVSGTVIDAATGRPIPKFRVERGLLFGGATEPTWQPGAIDATDGRYSAPLDPLATWTIRVVAPGYGVAESPGFRVDDPGAATRDFALVAEPWLEGIVRRPDGRPDATAQVAVVSPRSPAALNGPAFQKGLPAPILTVDGEGRYSTPRPEPPFLLAAVSEAGYAEATPEDVAKSPDLALRPWGRIEGTARIGDGPAAGAAVEFRPNRAGVGAPRVDEVARAQADAQGRYVLERVVPKAGSISRMVVSRGGGRRAGATEFVDVKPGETARVDIGGGGRPVVGRAVFEEPVDWIHNSPVLLVVDRPAGERSKYTQYYSGDYDDDGRFRVEDVTPGRYRLVVQVAASISAPPTAPRGTRARTARTIVVPEGDAATPVDVGEVVVEPEPPR